MYKNYSLCLEYLNSYWFSNYDSIEISNTSSFYYGEYIKSIEISMLFNELHKPCKILPGMTIVPDIDYDNKWNNKYLAILSFFIDHNNEAIPIVDDWFQIHELLNVLDNACSSNHLQSI